jgi:predicted membrane protein
MRKTAFASAAFAFIILIFGLLLLLYHVPLSNYLLSLGLLLLAISLIIFYTIDKKLMYVVGAISCILPITGLLFLQLNLPGANFFVALGLLTFALLFIPWYAITSYKKE